MKNSPQFEASFIVFFFLGSLIRVIKNVVSQRITKKTCVVSFNQPTKRQQQVITAKGQPSPQSHFTKGPRQSNSNL
jgi:hypothetical protein